MVQKERRESASENAVLLVGLGLALVGITLYLLVTRLHIRPSQLVEAGLYLLILITAVAVPISWRIHDPGMRKKRDPFVMPARRDRKYVAAAWKKHSVLLGYDMNFKPWLWSDRVRTMQSVVVGMSGSGKTTLLENVATQDIARWIGTPENPKRVPMILFDGKGDLEFFHRLLPHVHRAGRLEQLRLLNPSQADLSCLYNPFHAPDGDYMANVGMIFGSFNLHDEFFAKHQLNYLGDVVRVGTYFFDLPTAEERRQIWNIYQSKFGVLGEAPSDDGWTGAEIKECCRKAYRLRISLSEAAQYTVPISRSAAEQIKALRQSASGKFLSASVPGIYTWDENTLTTNMGRRLRAAGE